MRRELCDHRVPHYQLAFAGILMRPRAFFLLMYKLPYSARVQAFYFRGGYFDAERISNYGAKLLRSSAVVYFNPQDE